MVAQGADGVVSSLGSSGDRGPVGAVDDLAKRGDVSVECIPTGIGEAHVDPASSILRGTVDHDVAGVVQGGELLGQRGVGESQPIADEREVDPVGGGQQGDDGQPRARVDELVESRLGRHRATLRIARRRTAAISSGPPRATAIAAMTPAIVAGWFAPSASISNAAAMVSATRPTRNATTNALTCVPARSARTLNEPDLLLPDNTFCATAAWAAPNANVAPSASQPGPRSAMSPSPIH